MSQRGSSSMIELTQSHTRVSVWGQVRTIFAFTCALTLGITLTTPAQEPAPTLTPTTLGLKVVLVVDGAQREVVTSCTTVQEFLQFAGVTLAKPDRVEPDGPTRLTDGMTIHVYRITCDWIKERVPIPAPVITRWHPRVTQHPVRLREGKPGEAELTRVVWKKDGVVSAQWVQSSKVLTHPQPAMELRGPLPSRGVNRVLYVVATAYDPGPRSCGRRATGHTAIGMHAGYGVIAVDPRVIPLAAVSMSRGTAWPSRRIPAAPSRDVISMSASKPVGKPATGDGAISASRSSISDSSPVRKCRWARIT